MLSLSMSSVGDMGPATIAVTGPAVPNSGILGLTTTIPVANAMAVLAVTFGPLNLPALILGRTETTIQVVIPTGLGLGPVNVNLASARNTINVVGLFTITL